MTIRTWIAITGSILTITIAWSVLVSVDSTRVVSAADPDTPPPNTILHAVIVTMLAVTTIVTCNILCSVILRRTTQKEHEQQDRRIDTLAENLDALAAAQAQLAAALAHLAHAAEKHAASGDNTAEICYPIPPVRPTARATAPVLAASNGRAVAPVSSTGQVVKMPQNVAADRSRRRRRKNGGPAKEPVPEGYLADMSGAVELGRRIEAERHRRGPGDPDPV